MSKKCGCNVRGSLMDIVYIDVNSEDDYMYVNDKYMYSEWDNDDRLYNDCEEREVFESELKNRMK